MGYFSYLLERENRFLLIGLSILVIAAIFVASGRALERYSDHVIRIEDEPKRFWQDVWFFIIAGLFFVALHWYRSSR